MEKYVDLQVMDINILRQFSMTMEVLADVFQGDALKPARHRALRILATLDQALTERNYRAGNRNHD